MSCDTVCDITPVEGEAVTLRRELATPNDECPVSAPVAMRRF
jgi:hypothetical protein